MKPGAIAFCIFALAASAAFAANAQDPIQAPDHSGKQVDGKTNGISPSTATTLQKQEKQQPPVQGGETLGGNAAVQGTPKN